MLYTKYAAWSYEQEIRVWANRGEAENGIYFVPIDQALMMLGEVILGARCSLDLPTVTDVVETYSPPVRIIKGRRSWLMLLYRV
jgi:hypothetical protein